MVEVGSDLGMTCVPPYLLRQGYLELAAQNCCHLYPPKQQQQGKEKVLKHHVHIIVIQCLHLKTLNQEC